MTQGNWGRALSFQALLAQAAWVGIRLMIGYRALAEGADPLFLGVVASAFALPALIAGLPAGRIADQFGGARMATTGLIFSSAGIMLMVAIPGLPFLLVASLIIGMGNLLIIVGQQTFTAHASVNGSKDNAFGNLTAATSIGQLIGPPAVTLVASIGGGIGGEPPNTDLSLLVCLGFNLLALPGIFLLRRTDLELRQKRRLVSNLKPRGGRLYRTPGLGRSLMVSGAVLVSVDLMYAFLPVWATEKNISVVVVGALLSLRAIVAVVSRIGLKQLVSKFGRKTLLITAVLVAVVSFAVLPLVGFVGAIFVMIGLGIGLGIPQPLTMAWVVSLTPVNQHGAALGMRLVANRLAQVSLPTAVGIFAAPLGILGIFWANAALLSISAFIIAGGNPDADAHSSPDDEE